MNRSSFKRPAYAPARTVHTPIPPEQRRAAAIREVLGSSPPRPKEAPVRSEPYRRLVAAMPCKACGIQGSSQAAHPNSNKTKGVKADDRKVFALCCDRPGIKGCHARFDQYEFGGWHAQALMEQAWGADTRRQITAMGQWPKSLPRLESYV